MRRELAIVPIAALNLVACGSDDRLVSIEGAWARASAEGQTTGAIYFEVTADDDDMLLAAAVPASVAASAELHEVVTADHAMDDDGGTGDDHGIDEIGDQVETAMVMRQRAEGMALPAGDTVVLEPGGAHVMLVDLVEPLEVGDEFELTLDFLDADDVTATVEVAEAAP